MYKNRKMQNANRKKQIANKKDKLKTQIRKAYKKRQIKKGIQKIKNSN